MRLLALINAAVLRLVCARRKIQGIDVFFHEEDVENASAVWEKVEGGLGLVARCAPRQLERVRRLVTNILVLDTHDDIGGKWFRETRSIHLDYKYILTPDASGFSVGATIVHEATHAWLESRGFAYRADRRQRIEAICNRSQAAYARQFVGGAPVAAWYEARAAGILASGEYYTDDAFAKRRRTVLDRHQEHLRQLGAPRLMLSALRWLARRRST